MTDATTLSDQTLKQNGFRDFDDGATESIQAIAYNNPGDRIAIAFADHRIRVYDQKTAGPWVLFDLWRGHDAEILDASRLTSRVRGTSAKFVISRFNG